MIQSKIETGDSPIQSDLVSQSRSVSIKRYLFLLLLVCVGLGYYCCELNRQLYQHHHPFYDSLSYNNRLFRVMSLSKDVGLPKALDWACFTNSTNCLPFIIAALAGPFVEPSRMVGVWIQTGLLFFFVSSLFYLLTRINCLDAKLSLAACLAFLSTKCLFLPNGGLSDFRMDLSLYLTFSTTCIWFLASMSRPTKTHAVMMGLSASVACLCRATAPVYLLFALGPLLLFELFRNEERKRKLVGVGLAIAVLVLFAGWFFILNFEYLKYYYVEWNTDANAKIPFAKALKHAKLARGAVGGPLTLVIFCWGVATLLATRKIGTIRAWVSSAIKEREIDWRLAWIGVAPVVLMIARRAGLNGFVTMPAVFGMVLFVALPLLKQVDRLNQKQLTKFCWIILLLGLTVSLTRGWSRHSEDGFNSMAVNQRLIDVMVEDAKKQNRGRIKFAVIPLSDLNTEGMFSTLLFDCKAEKRERYRVTIDGIAISRTSTFTLPAVADWRNAEGATDDKKISNLVADANMSIDYIVISDVATANLLKKTKSNILINRYLLPIREQIVNDPSWKLVVSGLQAKENEIVEIYRKSR